MKSARYGLSRQLQTFFETELCGLYRFDQAEFLPPEEAARPEGWSHLRRPPYGKWRERIEVRFGVYDLSAASSNESPPLGEIKLASPEGEVSGPLDHETWRRMGEFIWNRERALAG